MDLLSTLPVSLRQLQYLVAVADHGSFRRAADACHVAQPSLSAQVGVAEQALGVQLFERTGRRVRVPPPAAPLVAQARRILMAGGGGFFPPSPPPPPPHCSPPPGGHPRVWDKAGGGGPPPPPRAGAKG